MRRVLFLAAAALVAAACGGIDHGYVTSKRDVPAHDESYLRRVQMGESCRTTTSGSGANRTTRTTCEPNYIYVPDHMWVERACFVSLQNEKESGEARVGCDGWDKIKINDNITLK